jgi:protein-tyrosine phosphatase
MKNILTVCIGNICRSPVAEALFKERLPGYKIWSAGLQAVVDHPAEAMACEIAAQYGLDLSAHRAQQIESWMCRYADLVLVMEVSQQHQLERLYPLARGKIRRLGEFGPQGAFDIADPYKQPRTAFEASHTAIAIGVDEWVRRIKLVS